VRRHRLLYLQSADMPDVTIDSATIHYDTVGDGPVVLMLQGVGLTGAAWKPQVDDLRSRYTVITVDNRGVGGSDAGGRALTIERMAADALAVLDAEGVSSAHVVGHSMGGAISLALAVQAPSRVRSLSLLCTFRRGRDATALSPGIIWYGLRTRIGTRAMRRNAFLDLVMPAEWLRTVDRDALAARVGAIFGRDLADEPGMTMPQLRAMARFDPGNGLAALGSIPTIVVSAAEDRIARPASGRALAAAIPGARYVEVPGAGHAVPLQRADEINGLLREHIGAADSREHIGRPPGL